MEAKALLTRARQADRRMRAAMERWQRCRAVSEAVGVAAGEDLVALEAELARQAEAWAGAQLRAGAVIDTLANPVDREVLRYRYLDGLDWDAISRRMCCSTGWLWKVHARAVETLGDVNNM